MNRKRRFQDVDNLLQGRSQNLPKPKEYLFDYQLQEALKQRETYSKEEFRQKFKIDFEDLPISRLTLKALNQRNFKRMTEIQRCAIPHALAGRDILGASKTGSGKTLSYLVPLIETLYVDKWSPMDGLGAIVLLPTRELAMQVFEVYNSIAKEHIMSVALLIGGKNYQYEKERISTMNVIVCTPGRLLQHFEESPGFDAANLKMLIIDEADMMFELGFWPALKAVLRYLPQEKQTMLYSATLSKSIHQLSQISLKNPETIYLHDKTNTETSNFQTPNKLQQFYMVVPVQDKVDLLFSFLKNHTRQKILVFLSSCKQVRFIFEAFRKLKIGIPLLELHGRQKQDKRTAIFFTFTEKRQAVLFTTNVASRGLDFPKVDWVISMDCPEDVENYIHRVGRTARYNAGGFSLLLLLPSEVKFAEKVAAKGIELKQKFPNTGRQLTVRQSLQSMVSENIDLKYLAQRAFVSYIRSIDINGDKEVFNVHNIETDQLAESYGLVQVPIIQIMDRPPPEAPKRSKLQKLKYKIEIKKQMALEANKPLEVGHLKTVQRESDLTKFDQMKAQSSLKKQDDLAGGLLKRKPVEEMTEIPEARFVVSKNQLKKVKLDGIFGGRNKTFFNDEGVAITYDELRKKEIEAEQQNTITNNIDFTHRYRQKLQDNAEGDKANEIARRKQKRQKRKERQQEFEYGDGGADAEAEAE